MNKKTIYIIVVLSEIVVIAFLLGKYILRNEKFPNIFVSDTDERPFHWRIFELYAPLENTNLYYPRPNATILYDGYVQKLPKVTTIKINSDGFRDREYTMEKSKNVFRIIVLGDSQTFGLGVKNDEPYSEVLEKKFQQIEGNLSYEVLNFGVPGYGIVQSIDFLEIKGLKYSPDVIIISFNGNTDLADFISYEDIAKNISGEVLSRYNVTEEEFDKLPYEKRIIIEIDATEAVENYVQDNLDYVWKGIFDAFNRLYDITLSKNIKVVILGIDTDADKRNRLEDIARTFGWNFIDPTEELEKYPIKEIRFIGDWHYTPMGHKIIADELFQYVVKNKLVPLSSEQFKFYNN